MSVHYNTPLSAAEQKAYGEWMAKLMKEQGRDVSADVRDYDMQGFFKSGQKQAENGHFTDEFKKPSHPTFSTESKYHGKGGNEGGKWIDLGGGKWAFEPGRTNLQHHSAAGLAQYFRRVEPDVTLKLSDMVQ